MRNVSLCCNIIKLSSTIGTWSSIIILVFLWLIGATSTSSASITIASTSSSGSTHSLSKLFRLVFPFGPCPWSFYGHILSILSLLLTSWAFRRWITSFSLHEDLLMFWRDDSMSLTIKGFSFLNKNLLTNFSMLCKSLWIEWSATAWALSQIHISVWLKCIWSKISSKSTPTLFLSNCWNDLLGYLIIVTHIALSILLLRCVSLILWWSSSCRSLALRWFIMWLLFFKLRF